MKNRIKIKIKHGPYGSHDWSFRVENNGLLIAEGVGYAERQICIRSAQEAKERYLYRNWVTI